MDSRSSFISPFMMPPFKWFLASFNMWRGKWKGWVVSMHFTFFSAAVDLHHGKGKEWACFFYEKTKIINQIKKWSQMYLGNTPDSPIKYSAPGVCTRPLNQARERQGYFVRNWVNRPRCFQEHLEYGVGLGWPISVHAQDLHRRLFNRQGTYNTH